MSLNRSRSPHIEDALAVHAMYVSPQPTDNQPSNNPAVADASAESSNDPGLRSVVPSRRPPSQNPSEPPRERNASPRGSSSSYSTVGSPIQITPREFTSGPKSQSSPRVLIVRGSEGSFNQNATSSPSALACGPGRGSSSHFENTFQDAPQDPSEVIFVQQVRTQAVQAVNHVVQEAQQHVHNVKQEYAQRAMNLQREASEFKLAVESDAVNYKQMVDFQYQQQVLKVESDAMNYKQMIDSQSTQEVLRVQSEGQKQQACSQAQVSQLLETVQAQCLRMEEQNKLIADLRSQLTPTAVQQSPPCPTGACGCPGGPRHELVS